MTEKTFPAGMSEELAQRGHHDAFTGLPNRFLLGDRLEVALAQARRYDNLVALIVIDLNKSTEVRAALGLDDGDELTRMVSERLQEFARKSDTLTYIGGDLFTVVMPRVRDLPQILRLTSRLMKLFDGAWEVAGQSVHLTPGVGISYFPENGEDVSELLAHAVTAARRAARQGDRLPHLADPVWHAEARERLALEADLRHAIEREQLTLFYQPQVNAASGSVSGFEALIRWRHPERGMVAPNDFIPLAEETHLILPIGTWVIGEACRQLALWRNAGHPDGRVAVNLAAEQLADKGLVGVVKDALSGHGIKPAHLEVEITERTAIANESATARAFEQLHSLGVRITLDDFGTGYSSALLFVQYSFDTLKIDRSFVGRVVNGAKERMVASGIIELAHAAGMTVVAEGVETREQLHLMHELGADEIQGYFFSRPLPAAECEPFLLGRCDVARGGTASSTALA
jgi:polar amino acid transport system substrate-binding protein